jgi:acetylornithine/succinyldiaminopimelate/putrescine aminotransferase
MTPMAIVTDFVCSGALAARARHPAVSAAIADQAQKGTSYGVTTELEVQLAQKIRQAIPFLEKIRFVSSGTEATTSALRLARGFTGRDLLIKFEGCYHGHADSFLSQAGSGLATLGIAECPGVPQPLAQLTLNAPYNDLLATLKLFEAHPTLPQSSNRSPPTWVSSLPELISARSSRPHQSTWRAADRRRSHHRIPPAQRLGARLFRC